MSRMEVFAGTIEVCTDQNIVVRDDDDFYDMEEAHGCYYVKVDDVVWRVDPGPELDEYGFNVVLESSKPMVLCYWYNGGAGLHEVVEAAIRSWANGKK